MQPVTFYSRIASLTGNISAYYEIMSCSMTYRCRKSDMELFVINNQNKNNIFPTCLSEKNMFQYVFLHNKINA